MRKARFVRTFYTKNEFFKSKTFISYFFVKLYILIITSLSQYIKQNRIYY